MKAVLDEAVPKRLADALQRCDLAVAGFPREWKGSKDGALLSLIVAEGFDTLLTCDKNLRFQQSLVSRPLSLVVLPVQRFPDLLPLVPTIAEALHHLAHPSVIVIERAGRYVSLLSNEAGS